jgi:hypothetical protein
VEKTLKVGERERKRERERKVLEKEEGLGWVGDWVVTCE